MFKSLTRMPSSFAFCQCYYENNLFLRKWGRHVTLQNEQQFRRDYTHLLGQDIDEALKEAELEVQRRHQIRDNQSERRGHIQLHYVPLHPHVYTFEEAHFHSDFTQGTKLDKVGQGVYSVGKVFTADYVKQLLEELNHFKASGIEHERPNTMNRHGLLLDDLVDFTPLLDTIRSTYLQPLVRQIFPELASVELDSHKAFVVKYAMGEDVDLAAHFDNAEVTLNVSLSDNNQGGDLIFNEMNGCSRFGYEHVFTKGILHRGNHNHEALSIEEGERRNLIIWMRSSKVRNKMCPMCGQVPRLIPAPQGSYGDGFTINESSVCTIT